MDPSKRVDKEAIPTLETELLAAEESLNDISREIEFARKQELLLKEATGVYVRMCIYMLSSFHPVLSPHLPHHLT